MLDTNYQLLAETQGFSEQTVRLVLDNLAKSMRSQEKTTRIKTDFVKSIIQDIVNAAVGLFNSLRTIFNAPV